MQDLKCRSFSWRFSARAKKANLSKAERNELRDVLALITATYSQVGVTEMSKSGQSILRGARQALEYAHGRRDGFTAHVPEEVDVAAIRRRLKVSQGEFAARFGFKLDAVQNWEQGRRRPDGAARAFLRVIEREPAAVQRALTG
jgi:putative transcriptional regulator